MAVKNVKQKNFEHVYILNVPCVYASVIEPKKKLHEPAPDAKNQSKREYAITVFVDDADRETLEDEILINKELKKVGVEKNKKRRIKFPVKDEDGNETAFTPYKGLNGIQLSLNELTNAGKLANLNVLKRTEDGKTEPFTELVGNGSIVSIKLFAYRNQEDLLNVALDTIVVEKHVPYEGGSGGVVHDDVLGIDIDLNANKKSEPEAEQEAKATPAGDDFDDDVDF